MLFHIIIAFIFGGVLAELGSVLKFAFLPYLIYLVYNRKAEHIPAIILIMCFGTVLTLFMSVLLIPYCYIYRVKLRGQNWFRLYKVLLVMFPFYLAVTIVRMGAGITFIDAVIMNDYYVAFWFLLFGVINREFYNARFLSILLASGLVLGIISLFLVGIGLIGALTRLSNYFDIILIVLTLSHLFYSRVKINLWLLLFLFFSRAVIFGTTYKFTFLFGLILAFLTFVSERPRLKGSINRKSATKKFLPRLIILLPFLFLWTTIVLTPKYATNYASVEVDYDLGSNIVDQVLFKLFVDRGVIWLGTIQGIYENTGFLLPVKNWDITYTDVKNNFYQVDFESHNLILGLIRYNGYIFGSVLIAIYLIVMFQLYKVVHRFKGIHLIFAVSIFGLGIAVFITGQYTLQLSTSFIFMSLVGVLISHGSIEPKSHNSNI